MPLALQQESSCLAVDTAPACIDWPAAQQALTQLSAACAELAQLVPLVGAGLAEQPPPSHAWSLLGALDAASRGGQISPADLERLEAVEGAAYAVDDALAAARARLGVARQSSAAFAANCADLAQAVGAVISATQRLLRM